jgi:hypothetical protein
MAQDISSLQDIVAYLPHARNVEPQNQLFLSNTRTNNGTAGLRNPFLCYGPVNTLPRRRMTSNSNSTGWESRDLSTARYSWRNNRTEFSVRGRCEVYITRVQYRSQSGEGKREESRVEAGSNTSTVALRVVGGDKNGSLKSESVKYGRESHGTRTRK